MGTAKTIERMREFVTKYKRDFELRKVAAKIIAPCKPKDYHGYAKAIYEFCRDKIKYAFDPHMVELVESPERVLEAGIADCDSICTLMASLNENIGLKTRFRTVKADPKRPNDFSHVYCMVRVPPSRFSSSSASGWISEDPTLPDKTFGWEPPGMLGFKDWAASKDKDGEDELGIGDIPMSPVSESQAQMELDKMCRQISQKLVHLMRSGAQLKAPGAVQQASNGANSVMQAARGPGSATQRLANVQNAYAFWSRSMDQLGPQISTPQLPPNFSGYTSMSGLGVDDDTNTRWMNSYVTQIGARVSRLAAGGAKEKFPAEMTILESMLQGMRQEATYGDPDLNTKERSVYRVYKKAVVLAQSIAQRMDRIGSPVHLPTDVSPTWWERFTKRWIDPVTDTVKAIPRVVAKAPHKPTVVYPAQAPVLVPPEPETVNPFTPTPIQPTVPTGPIPGSIYGPVKPAIPWIPIGIGVAAAVYLYMQQQKTSKRGNA